VNKGISLEDFKFITGWSMPTACGESPGGALRGAFRCLPGAPQPVAAPGARLLLLFGMGGRGFVGWWMVKSGLQVRPSPSLGCTHQANTLGLKLPPPSHMQSHRRFSRAEAYPCPSLGCTHSLRLCPRALKLPLNLGLSFTVACRSRQMSTQCPA